MSRFNDRKEETREVKKHLIDLGYKNVNVRHGKGTARGWITVSVDISKPKGCYCTLNQWGQTERCHHCKDEYSKHYSLLCRGVMDFTGRSGDYDGRTGVEIGWIEPELKQVEPQTRCECAGCSDLPF